MNSPAAVLSYSACIALLLFTGLRQSVPPPPGDPGGLALIAGVMDQPGGWIQLCLAEEPLPKFPPVPLRIPMLIGRPFIPDKPQKELLVKNRDRILPAMRQLLNGFDFTAGGPAAQPAKDAGDRRANLDPHSLNYLHLEIIRGLHLTEVLPELLAAESRLNDALTYAEANTRAPLATLDLGTSPYYTEPGGTGETALRVFRDTPGDRRERDLFAARVSHRELLATILSLLRDQNWQPAIRWSGEMMRIAGVQMAAESHAAIDDAARRLDAALKNHDRKLGEMLLSEIREEEYRKKSAEGIGSSLAKYDPGIRVQIRGLAERFLRSVPANDRLIAAGWQENTAWWGR